MISVAYHARSAERRAHRYLHRSYYEEVLIVRVHPDILAAEGVPIEGGAGARAI